MAFVQLAGEGPWWPHPPAIAIGNGVSKIDPANYVIDATGEMVAMMGRFWHPSRAAKDIRKVGFRWGTVVKAGGSGLTLSLQDVSLTAGPPTQPDGTQDQTVAIAAADVTTVSWHLTGALSADRTTTPGDLLAVVWEFDGGGRLGADSFAVAAFNAEAQSVSRHQRIAMKTGGTWAIAAEQIPVLFECSDGTYGCLGSVNWAMKDITTVAVNTGTTPDEYAQRFVPGVPMKVDGAWVECHVAAGADYDMILYDGTSAMTGGSVSFDNDAWDADTVYRRGFVDFSQEVELTAAGVYYLAIKPTTATSVTIPVMDVDNNAHLAVHPLGIQGYAAHRTDAGAWTTVTTRRLFAGLRISSLSDGAVPGVGSHNMAGGLLV